VDGVKKKRREKKKTKSRGSTNNGKLRRTQKASQEKSSPIPPKGKAPKRKKGRARGEKRMVTGRPFWIKVKNSGGEKKTAWGTRGVV